MTDLRNDLVASVLREVAAQAERAGTPILVHLVANGVRGDSRVIKSAQASMAQGFTTIVLGITTRAHPESLRVEGVTALLIPFDRAADQRQAARDWRPYARGIARRRAVQAPRAFLGKLRSAPDPVAHAGLSPVSRTPAWALPHPVYLTINLGFARALAALQPDVIHAQDTAPLPAAVAHAASRPRRTGRVAVLYDAHECVPELIKSFPDSGPTQAVFAMENEFIRDCDAVATVSPEIASVLRKAHRLRVAPDVITNAPPAVRDQRAPDLRAVVGVPPETPLAVYSGWIAPERGLATVIRALPNLPDLHLAIVANTNNNATAAIRRLAEVVGVADRVHFAGYVPPGQVTQYLSSATVGLIPRKPGGHLDLSLPTKFREFLHAGLPIVASSNRAMTREIKATGVGEVFKAGSVPGFTARVGRVLADPDRYRRAITPELLEKHSWEAQAKVLTSIYARITPQPPRPGPTVDAAEIVRRRLGEHHVEGDQAFRAVDSRLLGVLLGIGRSNSAGQAHYWAEAVTHHLRVPARSFGAERELSHTPHVIVPRMGPDRARAALELRRLLVSYSHVLIDGFEPLLGGLLGEDIELEIATLQRSGLSVALAAHGSDVRDPAAHQARFAASYFRHASAEWLDLIGTIAARNREIATGFMARGGLVFVSTPDLLHDLPGARWLPIVVDLDLWSDLPEAEGGTRPRVLHRPSRSDPPIKGSDVIVPVLEELHLAGVIEYLPDPGVVPASEMPSLVAGADIVVDQIRSGSYGVAAVEAMAAGRVVVGNLSADVREAIGSPVPIVDGSPETLAEVLTALAGDPERRARLAAEGRGYTARWHSGAVSARALRPFLES